MGSFGLLPLHPDAGADGDPPSAFSVDAPHDTASPSAAIPYRLPHADALRPVLLPLTVNYQCIDALTFVMQRAASRVGDACEESADAAANPSVSGTGTSAPLCTRPEVAVPPVPQAAAAAIPPQYSCICLDVYSSGSIHTSLLTPAFADALRTLLLPWPPNRPRSTGAEAGRLDSVAPGLLCVNIDAEDNVLFVRFQRSFCDSFVPMGMEPECASASGGWVYQSATGSGSGSIVAAGAEPGGEPLALTPVYRVEADPCTEAAPLPLESASGSG